MGITSLPPATAPSEGGTTGPDIGGGTGGIGSTSGPIYSTANSVGTGVESIFMYNGLTLNDLSVYDRYRISRIEGLGDADVRDSREIHPARHGEEALISLYGGRTIILSGRIEAWTLNMMRDMQMALRTAFAPLVESDLLVLTGRGFARDYLVRCRKTQSIVMAEEQRDFNFWRDFMITLRASDPRLLSREIVTSTHDFSGGGGGGESVLQPLNKGNFTALPIIVLTGPMVNPQIAVDQWQDGAPLRLNITLAEGEQRRIDVAKRLIQDGAGASRFSEYVIGSSWLELPPGTSDINFWAEGLSSSSSITVYHQHSWI